MFWDGQGLVFGRVQKESRLYWETRLDELAKVYARHHYIVAEFREKKIPDKQTLTLMLGNAGMAQWNYPKLYEKCRQAIKDEYPRYVARVLRGEQAR